MPQRHTPRRLTTSQAADEINRLAELYGSARRVRSGTVKDWRADGKGPRYVRVSGRFVEYPADDLARWVREEYLGLSEQAIPA